MFEHSRIIMLIIHIINYYCIEFVFKIVIIYLKFHFNFGDQMVNPNYEALKIDLKGMMNDVDLEDVDHERKRLNALFEETFGKDNIDDLDRIKAERFFKELNRTFKNNVKFKLAMEDFPQFKKGIKYLLYGKDDLFDRINNTLHYDQEGNYPYKIIGMQRSPTILLNLNDPENCCIWNNGTQKVFFKYNLLEPINHSSTMYDHNNRIQKRLASDLGLDLFKLDYVMRMFFKSKK